MVYPLGPLAGACLPDEAYRLAPGTPLRTALCETVDGPHRGRARVLVALFTDGDDCDSRPRHTLEAARDAVARARARGWDFCFCGPSARFPASVGINAHVPFAGRSAAALAGALGELSQCASASRVRLSRGAGAGAGASLRAAPAPHPPPGGASLDADHPPAALL